MPSQEGEERARHLGERMAQRRREKDTEGEQQRRGREDSAPGRKRRHEDLKKDDAAEEQPALEPAEGARWQTGCAGSSRHHS